MLSTTDRPKTSRRSLLRLVIFVLVLALIAGAVYMAYRYYQQTQAQIEFLSSPEGQRQVSSQEAEEVVAGLGQLTILPAEDPVVATIIDAAYLATQSAFYKDAINGDKLVVFQGAQKAYIYSPSRKLIVNAGPLFVNNQPQTPTPVEQDSTESASFSEE